MVSTSWCKLIHGCDTSRLCWFIPAKNLSCLSFLWHSQHDNHLLCASSTPICQTVWSGLWEAEDQLLCRQSGPCEAAEISESSLHRARQLECQISTENKEQKGKKKYQFKCEAKVHFQNYIFSCQTGYSNDVLVLNNMKHQTSCFTITWVDLILSICTFLKHHCSINTSYGKKKKKRKK